MPSQKVLELKQQQVTEISAKLKDSCAGVVVAYKGISVADDTKLRAELREAGVEYSVIKNTILRRAVKEAELDALTDSLTGSTAIATSKDDYVAAARILAKYAEKSNSFALKSGYIDKEVIDLEKLANLAKLPSRDILLATVLGAFNAPIAAFARAIQAIVDKDGGEAAPAEETEAVQEAPAEEAPAQDAAPEAAPAE